MLCKNWYKHDPEYARNVHSIIDYLTHRVEPVRFSGDVCGPIVHYPTRTLVYTNHLDGTADIRMIRVRKDSQ